MPSAAEPAWMASGFCCAEAQLGWDCEGTSRCKAAATASAASKANLKPDLLKVSRSALTSLKSHYLSLPLLPTLLLLLPTLSPLSLHPDEYLQTPSSTTWDWGTKFTPPIRSNVLNLLSAPSFINIYLFRRLIHLLLLLAFTTPSFNNLIPNFYLLRSFSTSSSSFLIHLTSLSLSSPYLTGIIISITLSNRLDSLIPLLPFLIRFFFKTLNSYRIRFKYLIKALTTFIFTQILTHIHDSNIYSLKFNKPFSLISPPLEFLKYNYNNNASHGSSPFWNILICFGGMYGFNGGFELGRIFRERRFNVDSVTILGTLMFYGVISHKETRFLSCLYFPMFRVTRSTKRPRFVNIFHGIFTLITFSILILHQRGVIISDGSDVYGEIKEGHCFYNTYPPVNGRWIRDHYFEECEWITTVLKRDELEEVINEGQRWKTEVVEDRWWFSFDFDSGFNYILTRYKIN